MNPITQYVSIYDEISQNNSSTIFLFLFFLYSFLLVVVCFFLGTCHLLCLYRPKLMIKTLCTATTHATSTSRNKKILADCPILQNHSTHFLLRSCFVQSLLHRVMVHQHHHIHFDFQYARQMFKLYGGGKLVFTWTFLGHYVAEGATAVVRFALFFFKKKSCWNNI